jgi:hypothetical protein
MDAKSASQLKCQGLPTKQSKNTHENLYSSQPPIDRQLLSLHVRKLPVLFSFTATCGKLMANGLKPTALPNQLSG